MSSERIITLFGEEVIPEQVKAAGKSRAKKKSEEQSDDDSVEEKGAHSENEGAEQPIADAPQPITVLAPEVVNAEAATNTPEVDTNVPADDKKKIKLPKAETKPAELPEDWKGDKQYFTIGEVADLFKVKTSHIRFWTNEFKLKVRTTRKGDRLYTNEQIRELRAIHHLVKERGFTLTGAKAKLKAQNNMDVETVDLKKSLLQLRNKLLAIKNQLK